MNLLMNLFRSMWGSGDNRTSIDWGLIFLDGERNITAN